MFWPLAAAIAASISVGGDKISTSHAHVPTTTINPTSISISTSADVSATDPIESYFPTKVPLVTSRALQSVSFKFVSVFTTDKYALNSCFYRFSYF